MANTNRYQIPKEAREDYMRRLNAPRANGGQSFLDMYDNAPGYELAVNRIVGPGHMRFMSPDSSARLAFDMFSALDGKADKLELEKPLPGLSRHTPPHMDAYYEAGNHVVFIESIYKETFNYLYIKHPYQLGHGELNPSYYDTKGPRRLFLGFNLDQEVAARFCEFCHEVDEEFQRFFQQPGGFRWLNAKQQTTHLRGIIGWALRWGLSPRDLRGKTLHFITSVWPMAGDRVSAEEEGTFPHFFKREAERLVADIFEARKLRCEFVYEVAATQELVLPGIGPLSGLKAFALDCGMEELLDRYKLPRDERRRTHKPAFSGTWPET